MAVITNSALRTVFVAFAFGVQVLLVLNFAARNWRPALERRYGWVIYALGIVALLPAVVFARSGQPWSTVLAFLFYTAWAAFGFYVDTYRQIEWRNPLRLPVMLPYVFLFVAAQMAFWVPLWFVGRGYWIAYGVLYSVSTTLNWYSHRLMRTPA